MTKNVLIKILITGAFGLIAFGLRLLFVHFESADYIVYLQPWHDHLSQYGWRGFKDEFANYNLPYLYLLYLSTLIGIESLTAVKGITFLFEIVAAFAVYLIVRHFKPRGASPYIASGLFLLLPTVLMNGSLWGQCDVIYTAFLLFSFWAILKRKSYLTWIFFGLALSFKLQAIFFLPFLAFLWASQLSQGVRLRSFTAPLLGVGVFLLGWVPALAAGRPLESVAGIYISQAGGNILTLNAPNIYQWLSDTHFAIINKIGLILTAFSTLAILVLAFIKQKRKELNDSQLLTLATLILVIVPFLLPQMHERYFFAAEVFSLVLAVAVNWRLLWITAGLQVTGALSYLPFLFGTQPIIPMNILPVIHIAIIVVLIYLLFHKPRRGQGRDAKEANFNHSTHI